MFLFISTQKKIENGKWNELLKVINDFLSFYPNEIISFLTAENYFVVNWNNQTRNANKIVEKNNCWILEEGLLSYKDELGARKFDLLFNDYSLGKDIGEFLDNHFTLLIHNNEKNETEVFSDAAGLQHTFFIKKKDMIVFSSSIVLCSMFSDFSLDYLAINEFLTTGNVYDGKIIFSDIEKIKNGTVLKVGNGEIIKNECYCELLDPLSVNTLKGEEAIKSTISTLDRVINRLKTVHDNISADITGGFDSRLLLAFLLRNSIQADYHVSGCDGDIDVIIAKEISRKFSLKLHHVITSNSNDYANLIEHKDYLVFVTNGMMSLEPYFKSFLSHKYAIGSKTIHCTGSGGEIFREYWSEFEFPFVGMRKKLRSNFMAWKHFDNGTINRIILNYPLNIDLKQHFKNIIDKHSSKYINVLNVPKIDYLYVILRMQYWGGAFRSANSHIQPFFTAFLTKAFISNAFNVHFSEKLRHKLIRRLMYTLNDTLSSIKTESGAPYQPLTFNNIGNYLRYYRNNIFSKTKKLLNKFHLNKAKENFIKNKISYGDFIPNENIENLIITDFFDKSKIKNLKCSSLSDIPLNQIHLWRLITLELVLKQSKKLQSAYNYHKIDL